MLIELRIRNFAVIDELSLELRSGLNVLSGETGGALMLHDARDLDLLGFGRAHPDEEALAHGRLAGPQLPCEDLVDDHVGQGVGLVGAPEGAPGE